MFDIIKIFFLTALSFAVAVSWTPLLTYFLYKYRLGKQIRDDGSAPVFAKMHEAKRGTPTMGGVLVWGTLLAIILACYYISVLFPDAPAARRPDSLGPSRIGR